MMASRHSLSPPPQPNYLLQPLHPLPGGIGNLLGPDLLRQLAIGQRGKLPGSHLAVWQGAGLEEWWWDWKMGGGWGGWGGWGGRF